MSKIRHIALTTNDLETSAEFYKGAFDLEEISRNDEAVILTDGYIVFALLEFKADRYGGGRPGLHHFGIKIEDMNAVEEKMSALGGQEMVEYNRTYGNREGTEDNWVGEKKVDGPPRGGLRYQPYRLGLNEPLAAANPHLHGRPMRNLQKRRYGNLHRHHLNLRPTPLDTGPVSEYGVTFLRRYDGCARVSMAG